MPNRYVRNLITIDDKIEEEDREVENDLMRAQKELTEAQIQYYKSLTEFNFMINRVLSSLDDSELKEIIKSRGINPVVKI